MSQGSRSGGAGKLEGRWRRGCVQKDSRLSLTTLSSVAAKKEKCGLTEAETSRKGDTAQLLDPRVCQREKPPLCGDSV